MCAFPSLYSFDAFGLQGPCMFAFYCIDFAFVKVNYITNLSEAFWFDSWSVTKKDAFRTLSIFKLFKDETFAPSAVFLLDNTSSGLINDQHTSVCSQVKKKKKKKFLFQLESADCHNNPPVMIARADGRTESRFAWILCQY